MLDELSEPQDLARQAEVRLDQRVGRDGGGRVVGAVEVPGVEAGEVLQRAEEFVAANCGGGGEGISLGGAVMER